MSPQVVKLERAPGTTIEYLVADRGDDVLGTMAVPVRGDVSPQTVISLLMTDFSWMPPGKTVHHHLVKGNILTSLRNEVVQRMQGDWVLYVDADMTWQPDAVHRLVAEREKYDLDILGGLCFRRYPPFQPTMYMRERPNDGGYIPLEKWGEDEIVEVDATGFAFVIVHKRVFEMIAGGPMPPFEYRTREGGPPPNYFRWEGLLGEDIRFCQDAKAAGARVWVHTGIPIGHIAEVEITHQDFLGQLATRDEASYLAHKAVNDQLGIATMPPDEARERLGWRR